MFALEIYSLLLEREKVLWDPDPREMSGTFHKCCYGWEGRCDQSKIINTIITCSSQNSPCSPEELKKNIGFGLKGGTQGRRGIL